MSNRKSLDHFIGIVEQSHTKTASAKPAELNQELLSKIANELVGVSRGNVTGTEPQMDAATDGSEAALALAGQNAGDVEMRDAAKPAPRAGQPVISDAAGTVEETKSFGREAISVAEAAGDTAKVAEIRRAQVIGTVMAESFNAGLEKQAFDQRYQESLELLQSRGMLENYDIVA